MALFEDFLQVIIDGVDVSDYVLSYQKNNSICEPGTSFALGFTRKKPNGDILEFTVSDPVTIYEKYPSSDLVLRGYITNINVNANNSEMRVQGMDKYILLSDYFIDTRLETAGQSVAYWISYICGLVNLDVQFDTYPGIATTGADGNGGTPLGMQRASEAIATLERKGAVYTRYDSDADKIVVYTLNDAEPKITINSSNLVDFDQTLGTKTTRNVVKVWGGHDYDWTTQQSHAYNAVARTTMDELPTDQTFVLASPEIRSQTFANIVAARILSITGTLDDIVIAECAGLYPSVDITNNAIINISQGEISYRADRMITSKGVSVTKGGGAQTTFTFGEKCPRITISPPPFFVYATYEGDSGGAAVSYDAGTSFLEFNEGLPASGIPAQSIAANAYNQLMMVTISGVYRRSGIADVWNRVTVLDETYPSNDEGEWQFLPTDITFSKVTKETGFMNRFHLLGYVSGGGGALPLGQERWWVYFTPDFGYTWSSMQLYIPGTGIAVGTASGLPSALINGNGMTPAQLRMLSNTLASGAIIWNVHAHDIVGDISGNVTVLVEGEPGVYSPPDTSAAETFYLGYVFVSETPGKIGWSYLRCGTWYMDGYAGGNVAAANKAYAENVIILTNPFDQLRLLHAPNCLFSIPNNREVAYIITTTHYTAYQFYIARTIGNYWTDYLGWDETDIPDWEVVTCTEGGSSAVPSTHYYTLLDYSSLNNNDIVRWVVVYAQRHKGTVGGDDYPTSTYISVDAIFFEDDITESPDNSLTTYRDTVNIGVPVDDYYSEDQPTYYGDGLFGWQAIDDSTASPVPREWTAPQPLPAGAAYSATTTYKTSSNTGYFAFSVGEHGHWHHDSRDQGWPDEKHPRDWGEHVNIGIYVVELDFDAKEISKITCKNFNFAEGHNPPPAESQPDRDDDLEDFATAGNPSQIMMMNTDLIWTRSNWPDHGGVYHYWITYPGFSVSKDTNPIGGQAGGASKHGVYKVPFYENTLLATARDIRVAGDDPQTWGGETHLWHVGPSFTWADVKPPPASPSGWAPFTRQHPSFGICTNENRAMASGVIQYYEGGDPNKPVYYDPTQYDYHFMWKAQRATPGNYTVLGSDMGVLDPYPSKPIGSKWASQGQFVIWVWDFRTASGSTGMENGGSSANWNFLD